MASERNVQASAPTWLRNLGFSSWLLVGFVLVIVGLIWLLGETSTIVMPVILATVLGAVAGPAVGWLERHRVPRIGGAILVLLGLVAIGVLIFCLVFGGISAQSGDISAKPNESLDKIQGWLSDVGVDNAQSAKEGAQEAAPEIRTTLLSGVAAGVEGLKSLVFFLAFAMLSTLFVLKDGPVMHRFINRHMGVPEPVANVVTTNIAKSLRSYFLAVTIIAAFNAVLIGGAALILGVPLAGTIAVVTFVGAYVPFVGAWVAGGFAVLIALSTGSTSDALIIGGRRPACERRAPAADPAVRDGRDAEPQPARGARRHDRRGRPVRDGRADARRPADLRGRAHRQRAAAGGGDPGLRVAEPAPSGWLSPPRARPRRTRARCVSWSAARRRGRCRAR